MPCCSKLLTHQGYDVIEAVDGPSRAGAPSRRTQPDLVCLDVMMPGLDGIEVCQRLRRQPEHAGLPILLLTALNRPEDKARGLEAGANDFLSKPFDESELSARLRSLLRTKALQDRLADLLGRYVSENVAAEVLRDPFAVSLGGRPAPRLDAVRRRPRLHGPGRRASARSNARPAEPVPDRRQRRRRTARRHRRRPPRRRRLRLLRRPGHALRRSRASGPRGARDPDRRPQAGDPVDAGHASAGRHRHHQRRGHRGQRRLGAPDALRGRR